MPKLRRAKQREAAGDVRPQSDIGANGRRNVKHFTDAAGATIIENVDGRFRLNAWTGKYERDDA